MSCSQQNDHEWLRGSPDNLAILECYHMCEPAAPNNDYLNHCTFVALQTWPRVCLPGQVQGKGGRVGFPGIEEEESYWCQEGASLGGFAQAQRCK